MTGFCLLLCWRKKLRNITLHTMNESVDRYGNIMTLQCIAGEKFRTVVLESLISIGFAPLFSSRTVLSQSHVVNVTRKVA